MTKDDAIDIIRDAGFGFLATAADGKPFVRPMMPYLTDDNNFLLALLSRSKTIEQIRNNPKVEMCFVDRKMSYCRIEGNAILSTNTEKKMIVFNGIPMLRQYFSGPEDPNFFLAEIQIQSAEAMTAHQKTPSQIMWVS